MKKLFAIMIVLMLLSLTLVSAKVAEIKEDGPFTKVKIIHEKKPDFAKPDKTGKPDKPGKPGPDNGKIRCDSSADWFLNNPDYYLNPLTIPENLTEGEVSSALVASTNEWDQHITSSNLFIDAPIIDETVFARGSVDFKNVVVFGDLGSSTIAVIEFWYTSSYEIIDWDITLNTDYTWGNADNGNFMDLQNILTHELGHSLGLIDLYNRGQCSTMTMYGYSGYNDILKRTLEGDDISSLLKVYS
jgi:hypothetical protein